MKRKLIRSLPLTGAIVLVVAVVFYIQEQAQAFNQRPFTKPETPVQRTTVSVVTAQTGTYAARVDAYGEAAAHYELTLSAQVSGQIATLTDGFEAGNRVAQGDLLASVEDSSYRESLATAQNTLASARVSLLEEERQGEQAKMEWQSSGLSGEPDSPLVLRAPQLTSARAAVTEAQAAVDAARYNLDQTHIKAPFDALITARSVAPGSYVQSGTELATLVSTDRLEISVSLSAEEWSQLPELSVLTSGHWPVTLTHTESGQHWSGHVIRARQHLDSTSRQRSLVIAVDAPFDQSPALLPGTFVQASLAGRDVDGLWKLPSTALSQSGEIWYVTADNTLAHFAADPVFASDGSIYIAPPAELDGKAEQVVRQPLSSYMEGMAVQPVEEQGNV
ncbi:efflux RND transporter periplasmic adaptor subunit [Marinobacter bohaiensis]|uniref:efflux RND transporter periplasmic adaptor subunit n=1 Tax=Marinobacter bohaiensis TaxID=2201898 RepID=UPI000DAB77A4|nr:efflux RND transporter periplasmic adaptor subunit [Marinobacter bohaiensis]